MWWSHQTTWRWRINKVWLVACKFFSVGDSIDPETPPQTWRCFLSLISPAKRGRHGDVFVYTIYVRDASIRSYGGLFTYTQIVKRRMQWCHQAAGGGIQIKSSVARWRHGIAGWLDYDRLKLDGRRRWWSICTQLCIELIALHLVAYAWSYVHLARSRQLDRVFYVYTHAHVRTESVCIVCVKF
jgi:hypothetical protein